ncbi:MAG: hypothetical protein B7Z34_04340 [Novosphingobium sp. 12-62-10]|nr:MAG: hypothetical protein B7Z34_04340 [Novosphingobium sp. 12-62-10]
MNDRYDWDRDSADKRRREAQRSSGYGSGDDRSRQQWGNEHPDDGRRYSTGEGDDFSTVYGGRNRPDMDRGNGQRDERGGYAGSSNYGSGYGPNTQSGDFFGPGDYGSGSHAWDRGSSRNAYAGGARSDYGAGGGYGSGQSTQRENRQWGDRQQGSHQPRDDQDRGFLDRATDEVKSWWGDEDAARRREQDHVNDHRGRGPADYTRSDERIREDANDRLTDDWSVDARQITVTVKDGEVTLAGTVASRQEKHRAEECVERLSGVKHVQNNLRVQSASEASTGTGATSGSATVTGTGATGFKTGSTTGS